MKPTILLIDDDSYPFTHYLRALGRAGFEVDHCQSVDDVFTESRIRKSYALILLDIMLDPGERYGLADHFGGLRTGILLYPELIILYPSTPIIVITNVDDPEIREQVENLQPAPVVASKIAFPPLELVELIRRNLSH